MRESYNSKYYSDLQSFLEKGWTQEEINTYFPLLESLSEEDLFKLHQLCQIKMFSSGDPVDKEQAIHALVNPDDTPKEMLINALRSIETHK